MSQTRFPNGAELSILSDVLLEAQRSNLAFTVVVVQGYNPDVDNSADEDLIPWGGDYAFQTSAVAMEAVSSSAADAAAGTGLRTARVEGLDSSWAPVSETVTLNGTTPVALSNSYRRINAFYALTAGSGEVNAGTVDVRVTAGAVVQARMSVGVGASRHGIYTVPTGYAAYPLDFMAGLGRTSSDWLTISAQLRGDPTSSPVRRSLATIHLGGQATSNGEVRLARERVVGPYDLILRSSAGSANNSSVIGRLTLLMETTS